MSLLSTQNGGELPCFTYAFPKGWRSLPQTTQEQAAGGQGSFLQEFSPVNIHIYLVVRSHENTKYFYRMGQEMTSE